MTIEDAIEQAIAQVDAWGLEDSAWADAVNGQAMLLVETDVEPFTYLIDDTPYHALRF
ncbi:hypothetical protein GCM10007052_30990 [Halioglobus japonicus]|uniref:hypothetical protein n=1 Tax=Halioglobus japonicus TaxID=930805 RepID=UPI0012F5230F|nr:hypothetical protein [Halioglobus japonicus]GHD20888.1 hypothetical protein GCM10007052_30990 [Halioglobus japonicus]